MKTSEKLNTINTQINGIKDLLGLSSSASLSDLVNAISTSPQADVTKYHIFSSIEERDSSTIPFNNGDICVVRNEVETALSTTDPTNMVRYVDSFTMDPTITTSYTINYRGVSTPTVPRPLLTFSVNRTGAYISYTNEKGTRTARINYTTTDMINYTFSGIQVNSEGLIDQINKTFRTNELQAYYSGDLTKIIFATNIKITTTLWVYSNGSWVSLDLGINTSNDKVFSSKTYLTNDTVNLSTGTFFSNETMENSINILSDLTNNLGIYAQNITDISNMYGTLNAATKNTFTNINQLKTFNYVNLQSVTNASRLFNSFHNLTDVELNMSNATDTSLLFYNCRYLVSVNMSMPNATNVANMLGNCRNLVNVNVDVSNAENLSNLFGMGMNLQSVNIQSTKATNTAAMFNSCYNLLSIPNINATNIINAWAMFGYCRNITSVPNMDFSNATYITNIFASCNNIEGVLNLNFINATEMTNAFIDVGKVSDMSHIVLGDNIQNMSWAFARCYNLVNLPNINTSVCRNLAFTFEQTGIKSFPQLNTTNCTNMAFIFNSCNNMTGNPPLYDTSNCINFSGVFNGCYNITSIPNYNLINCNTLYSTFRNLNNITSIPNFNTSGVAYFNETLCECNKLSTMPNWDFSNSTNFYATFKNCKALSKFPNVYFNKPCNCANMFYGCNNLVFSNRDFSNITNGFCMFCNCLKLNLGTTNYTFNLPNVGCLKSFLYACNVNGNITINSTNKLYEISFIVSNCHSLNSINISDTSNVKYMDYAFFDVRYMTDAPEMDTSNVINAFGAFVGTNNLRNVPVYNLCNCTNMVNMFWYGWAGCKITAASIENLLQTCITATKISNKKLTSVFNNVTNYFSASTIQNMPSYQNFINAGWTIN